MKRGPRKQPQRTCISCRQVLAKRELIRVVRRPDGCVVVDPRGKISGRGAYLCLQPECWQQALQDHKIERALAVKLDAQQQHDLAVQLTALAKEKAET